jgi:hypothetical protein
MRLIVRCISWAMLLGSLAAPLAHAEGEPEADAAAAETAPPEQPKRAPITNIGGSAPAETPQQRLERFKRERGAGSDKPFEGFATQAEQDMQRVRDAAISGSGVAPGGGATNASDASLEQEILSDDEIAENRAQAQEMLQDRLFKLGAWGGSGCVTEEPDWSQQDDWIRHRPLVRGDFLSEQDEKATLAVRVPNAVVGAYVALVFSCELKPVLRQVREGLWAAEIANVHYYALLSRNSSWWNADPTLRGSEGYTLGHEQLHFDIADAFAKWLNQNRTKIVAKLRGSGRSPEEAVGQLQLSWAKHMLAVQEDFGAIETAYDRETKHGTVLDKQTFWSWRAKDGFAEIAKTVKLRTRKYVE